MSRAMRTAWNHMRRSPYQALAAIFIMMQTFMAISIFSFIIYGSAKTITYLEAAPQVTGFFKEGTTQAQIDEIKKQLQDSGKVTKLKFISQQDAFQIYKQQHKNDDPLLMDLVSPDILPPAYQVSAVSITDLSQIADIMTKSPYIGSGNVVFSQDVVNRLEVLTTALKKIGVIIIILFALDSIFIMSIIISIKISHKREEIEIMKLLSATNWYIRWPFIYEGIIYGVVGAFFGWLFSALLVWYATPFLQSFLGDIQLFPLSPTLFLELLAGELLLAILLGWFASFMSVLRYLK